MGYDDVYYEMAFKKGYAARMNGEPEPVFSHEGAARDPECYGEIRGWRKAQRALNPPRWRTALRAWFHRANPFRQA